RRSAWLMRRRHPCAPLFPYTPLFRSGLHRRRGHGEVRGRRVGHVVPGVSRRLAVLADIGAVEAEVADVARPHEVVDLVAVVADRDRKSTRLNSSHVKISYAVFCLKKK